MCENILVIQMHKNDSNTIKQLKNVRNKNE